MRTGGASGAAGQGNDVSQMCIRDSLCDEQGIPRICFGLTDVEAADGVCLLYTSSQLTDFAERVLPARSVANLYPMNYSGKTDPKGFFIGRDRFCLLYTSSFSSSVSF